MTNAYVRRLKNHILATSQVYKSEQHQKILEQNFREENKRFFLYLVTFYFAYVYTRTLIIWIIALVRQQQYDTVFHMHYYIFNFFLFPLPLILYRFAFKRCSDVMEIFQINILIFAYQGLGFAYLVVNEIDESNETKDYGYHILLNQVFILLLIIQRYFILKALGIFFYCGINVYIYSTKDIEFAIIGMLSNFALLYLIEFILMKITSLYISQKQYLKNLPSALLLLHQDTTQILYYNSSMKQLIRRNNNQTESLMKQGNSSSKSIVKLKDASYYEASHRKIFIYLSQLYVSLEEVLEQTPDISKHFQENIRIQDDENLVDLSSILKIIGDLRSLEDDKTYEFRCQLIEHDQDLQSQYSTWGNSKIIIDVRIKTGLKYSNEEAIMISFYDITRNMRTLYYKNMTSFKSRLIKSISHELRTRLNIIQGMIQIILDKDQTIGKRTFSYLQQIYNNCRIQTYIIGGIIDYNLLKDKQLSIQRSKCQIKELITDVLDIFKEESILKQINIKFINKLEAPYLVDIDGQRFMSVLVNVISNSLKFTQKGVIAITLTKEVKIIKSDLSMKLIKLNSLVQSNPLQRGTSIQLRQQAPQVIKNSESSRFLHMGASAKELVYKIKVQDSGEGITEEKLKMIQQVLNQDENDLQSNSESSDGLMMGLRVANQLLKYINNDKFGQFFTIRSIPLQGTTVSMLVKALSQNYNDQFDGSVLDESSMRELQIPSPLAFESFYQRNLNLDDNLPLQATSTQNKCGCVLDVLLVDDEVYNLMVLSSMMNICGIKTLTAKDGLECLDIVQKRLDKSLSEQHSNCRLFKFILMDYQMPNVNGRQAADKIRSICNQYKVPQVLIFGCTAFSGEEEVNQLTLAGMHKVYFKPINKGNIMEMNEIANKINAPYPNFSSPEYIAIGNQNDKDEEDQNFN